ncbi:MAG: DEAD/DEAH box helicase [Bacteroidia bacterium]|nr:DEAD/DEAH box helicase [Bacteroidia bacterium]
MKFSEFGISDELVRSLDQLGYKRPTDIQYKAIPSIMKGEDVLAIAQTGTGKTAAFAIPIVDRLHKRKSSKRSDGIKCLVMVPTHELAIQTSGSFGKIGKHTRVKSFGVFGGVEQEQQIAQLNKGIDVLIATPGRMFDLVHQGHLDLRKVEVLILDEADHMLDLGFYKDIQDLIRLLPRRRQTLYFSATINEKIKKLAYSIVKNPIRIQISPKNPVNKNIEHGVAMVEMDDKRFFLERLFKEQEDKKILVFVRTKIRAERVAKAMGRVEIQSTTLHGDKDQKERLQALRQFRESEVRMLIATDVSARGLDIPDVDQVINYDLPERGDVYVHRVGRTGRGKQRGSAISFCSSHEKDYLKNIESYIGDSVPRLEIGKEEYKHTLKGFGEKGGDWRQVIKEIEEEDDFRKKGRKKKKR